MCLKMLCTPVNPMVLLIIIPFLNGYFIGNINPTCSDKPRIQWLRSGAADVSHLSQAARLRFRVFFFIRNQPPNASHVSALSCFEASEATTVAFMFLKVLEPPVYSSRIGNEIRSSRNGTSAGLLCFEFNFLYGLAATT